MSAPPASVASNERLLTFQVDGRVYAMSIGGVLEVIEAERITCVPTLSKSCAAVMNWHGDALPLVSPRLLFEEHDGKGGEESAEMDLISAQVLVVSERSEGGARLGIPIDCVLGVVAGAAPASLSNELVVERRPLDGRIVSVLDPGRVVARAAEVIEREVGLRADAA